MSMENVAWAWDITGLSPNEKLVLIYLADGVWGREHFTLSCDRVARFSGLSENAVLDVITMLSDRGLIVPIEPTPLGMRYRLSAPHVEEGVAAPRRALTDAGFVYFLHAPAVGRIKIGTSLYPRVRVADVSKQAPVECVLLKIVRGGKRLEADLHKKFAADRSMGEWFNASARLLEYIESLPAVEAAA